MLIVLELFNDKSKGFPGFVKKREAGRGQMARVILPWPSAPFRERSILDPDLQVISLIVGISLDQVNTFR